MQKEFRFVLLSPELASRLTVAINSADLSLFAVDFLTLAVQSVSTGDFPTVQARYWNSTQLIVIDCLQCELARLLRCTDRDVRQARAELEAIDVVRTTLVKPTAGANRRRRNVYSISVNAVLSLPKREQLDLINLAILATDGDPFLSFANAGETPGTDRGSDRELTGELTGGMPGTGRELAGHVSHASKTHEHEHVFLSSVRFSAIPRDHVVAIRNGNASLFSEYFADVVRAGWAKDCDSDRLKLAGLFVHSLRIAADKPGAFINAVWKRRNVKPVTLSSTDEDIARRIAFSRGPVTQSGVRGSESVSERSVAARLAQSFSINQGDSKNAT